MSPRIEEIELTVESKSTERREPVRRQRTGSKTNEAEKPRAPTPSFPSEPNRANREPRLQLRPTDTSWPRFRTENTAADTSQTTEA